MRPLVDMSRPVCGTCGVRNAYLPATTCLPCAKGLRSAHMRAIREAAILADRLHAAKDARDQAIRAAIDAGNSQVDVARATGLSRARVQQILGRSA